jgi:DNA modification methylase
MSLPTPYYSQDGITIYCGDNRRIVPLLDEFDLLLTDPPYGISADENAHKNGVKCRANGFREYSKSDWDSAPPADWVIAMAREKCRDHIVWGGNYFSLPPTPCWLIWDKGQRDFSFADAELAWTNLSTAVRAITFHRGRMVREGGDHPTQKPLDVMSWCLSHAPDAKTVLDPWMGSGTTLVAAKLRGLRAVGIEINEEYCEIAVRRLAQGVLLTA